MAYKFCPRLNIPVKAGLSLRVVNNGTTGTPSWSGYNLEAIDPTGVFSVETSNDNSSWTQATTEIATVFTSAAINLNNPAVAKYFRIRALDATETTVYATSNVVTVIRANEPVTGLAITSATDDGTESDHFTLVYTCTEPATYTDTYVRVQVLVETVSVYDEFFAFNDAAIAPITNLPGAVSELVEIKITVLGRTGVLGAASSVASDTDTVVDDFDADAQAWIDDIETALGAPIAALDSEAINDCIVGLKAVTGNYFDDIYSMGLFWFANASANAVRAKIGGSITFPSGTATHSTDYIDFSSNGYANLGFSPSTAGMTATSCGLMVAVDPSTPVDSSDGVQVSGTELLQMHINAYGSNYGDPGAQTSRAAGGTTGTAGVYSLNRLNGNAQLRCESSGSSALLGSTSSGTGGTIPTINIFVGAWNNNGSPDLYTNRNYSFWLAPNKGVSATKHADALVYIYAMLATRGL